MYIYLYVYTYLSIHIKAPLPDVCVCRVSPELPVLKGREQLRVEPHGARRRLAHLLAVGRGQQRRRHPVDLRLIGVA